jgi:hypothetical protein
MDTFLMVRWWIRSSHTFFFSITCPSTHVTSFVAFAHLCKLPLFYHNPAECYTSGFQHVNLCCATSRLPSANIPFCQIVFFGTTQWTWVSLHWDETRLWKEQLGVRSHWQRISAWTYNESLATMPLCSAGALKPSITTKTLLVWSYPSFVDEVTDRFTLETASTKCSKAAEAFIFHRRWI